MMHITILSPSGRRKVELQQRNSIGRHSDNLIQIPDPSVSKAHCQITVEGNTMCFIEDRSSTNGTYVNNRRITNKTGIYAGDEIRLGDIILFLEGEEKTASLMVEIGIPDHILLKNFRFSPEEKAIMDIHPTKTREILGNFYFPVNLENVPLIAGSHHEKMDGTGYPNRLKGHEIPLASRIMAVADMFDALTAKRDYPKYINGKTLSYDPLPLSMVIPIIKEGEGGSFDKTVVKALMDCLPEIVNRFKSSYCFSGMDMTSPEK